MSVAPVAITGMVDNPEGLMTLDVLVGVAAGLQFAAVAQSLPLAPVQVAVPAPDVMLQLTLEPPSRLLVAVMVFPLAVLFWGDTYWAVGPALWTFSDQEEPGVLLTRLISAPAAPWRVRVPETV